MASKTDEQAHWQHVKALLAQVLDQPLQDRHALAERLTEGDAALRDELMSLLAAQADEKKLLGISPALALEALQSQLSQQNWIGRRIGAWRIVSLIARGGMGEVYRAERADGQFEQRVAIKLLRSGFDHEWLVSRFAVERQIVASLDHPNLARLLDGGTTEQGMPYFVMELVEGEPIDRYCQRLALPMAKRLALFRTVCQVVGYAHSKGVVHRDLKSDNILVTEQGVVKLVDFGIAKQLSVDADKTATGLRAMTLAFSSPEQVCGQDVTPASDVYSLGVALYRLLTQASPYGSITADSGYELMRAICDTEPQPPSRAETTAPLTSSQRRHLRGDLDAVVMMALRKDAALRYANAAEMGDDIFRHMESLPVHARRGAWSYRANRFVLRHRAVFGSAMLANLALVIGLGVAIYQNMEANRQRDRAEREQQRAQARVDQVRSLANVMIVDVSREIADLPGANAVRQLVAKSGLEYLETLAKDLPADPGLRFDTATAYIEVAEVTALGGTAKPEEIASGLSSLLKAEQILNTMRAMPAIPDLLADRAQLRRAKIALRRGQLLWRVDRTEEARAAYANGVPIAEDVFTRHADKPAVRYVLSGLYFELAQALLAKHDGDGFLALHTKYLRLAEDALARNANDITSRGNLLAAYAMLGDYQRDERPGGAAGLEQAIATHRRALALIDSATAEQRSRNLLHNAALGELSLGNMLVVRNSGRDSNDAIEVLDRARRRLEELVKADADNGAYLRDIASIRSAECAARTQSELDAGVESCRSAIKLFDKLPSADRKSDKPQSNPGFAQYWLGIGLQRRAALTGRPRAAKLAEHNEACGQLQASLAAAQTSEQRFGPFFALRVVHIQQALLTCPP